MKLELGMLFSTATLLLAGQLPAATQHGSSGGSAAAVSMARNIPSMVEADGQLRLTFGEERMVLPSGLQPSLLCTRSGTLVVQAQLPEKPYPSHRMTYPYLIATVVSRDGGLSWVEFPRKPGENGLNMEGGAIQLRDGTILALDTYVTPGKQAGEGFGQLYTSKDDWRTLQGPKDVPFDLPGSDFYGSTDDGGRPHDAMRAHRRILELPNGDLLATLYGWKQGDRTPSTYNPRMMKTRMLLVRSKDHGERWQLVSDVGVDPKVGTEGVGEPVLARISKGPNPGRLICMMRTGRELYETLSDDEGRTWTPAKPRVFAGLDIYRTELWVDMLRNFPDFKGKLLDENNPDELRGAVVDPDLIELRSGVLVAAFGVRVPQKLCWRHPEHPWNGNYLAFSQDHGKTWPNVVRMTSGILTTHYMALEEMPTDNQLFVTYDYGGWTKGMTRYVYGRPVQVAVKAK
jgi:hypothetical protein